MMRTVKVLLLSALVLGLALPVWATTSRVHSLAFTGDYLNDDSNIFKWYGVLPGYGNLVMAEVGTYSSATATAYSQALGVTYNCAEGKWGTWGLFLMNMVDEGSFFTDSPVDWNAPTVFTTPYNKFALAWGKEFGKVGLGVFFTRSDQGTEDKGAGTKYHKSYTTVGAGLRADVNEDLYADLALTLGFAGQDTVNLDKKTSFDIAGRAFYEWKDYVTLVPLFEFSRYEYLAEGDTAAGSGDKQIMFRFGVGMNVDVNSDNLLILAVEFARMKWEPSVADGEAAQTWVNLPIFYLALESQVKSWLTARVGALKSLYKFTDTNASGDDTITTSAMFEWFLGLGFHIAEFDLDMEISPALPFSVGYWITGYSPWQAQAFADGSIPEAPVGRISGVYHF
jgi:hypothetical protein